MQIPMAPLHILRLRFGMMSDVPTTPKLRVTAVMINVNKSRLFSTCELTICNSRCLVLDFTMLLCATKSVHRVGGKLAGK